MRSVPMTRFDDPKPFSEPVGVRFGGETLNVDSTAQAHDLLMHVDWPGERGPRHRDASATCLKVFDGHRSTEEARREFIAAAREAGILIEA